jgi:hypothetical protein
MAAIVLDDPKGYVKFKVAALWTSVMFCYALLRHLLALPA